MSHPRSDALEAWLICWGFQEITDWDGGPKAEAAFGELAQDSTFIFVRGRDTEDGLTVTFVFDPSTARSWAREGLVDLSGEPFNFKDKTAEAIVSEQRKQIFP